MSSTERLSTVGRISRPSTALKVIQLADDVAGGATSKPGNRTKALEFRAMTHRTGRYFVSLASRKEPPFFNAPGRNISRKLSTTVSAFELLQVVRNLKDALPE